MKRKPIFKLNRSKNIESVLLKQQTSVFRLKKKPSVTALMKFLYFALTHMEKWFIFWSYLTSAAEESGLATYSVLIAPP